LKAAIIAGGDLGRSPRAQYHALALAQRGHEVALVGESGSPCLDEVGTEPRIGVVRTAAPPFEDRDPDRRVGFALRSALRLLHQGAMQATAGVGALREARVVLVQSPPAIPTLPLAWLLARRRGARLVIDWHNLSASVLRAKLGRGSALPRALHAAEIRVGRRADAHLCVSFALRDRLSDLGIPGASVLPDRPHSRFLRCAPPPDAAARRSARTALGLARSDEPLLVAPTSWSRDEDFSPLLDALERWEGARPAARLRVVATGRGPLRRAFEARVAARAFEHSRVETRWLEHADYARLLACADLGLCFHRSSSGVDLPMKLADMRGAGLPVAVFDYGPVLGEVPGGEGGLLRFRTGAELAERLRALFGSDAAGAGLEALRRAVRRESLESWDAGWSREAAPALGLA